MTLQEWSNTSDPDFAAEIIRRAPLDLTQVPSNAQAQRLAKIYMAKRNPRMVRPGAQQFSRPQRDRRSSGDAEL